jgi:branched-chain amino acid transport system substrate-binding protein
VNLAPSQVCTRAQAEPMWSKQLVLTGRITPLKPMSGEQARWGYENLDLTQAKLDALGFKGVMRPVSTSCFDHMGSAWARVHTWDGAKFTWASDWLQADEQIIKPMVKSSAEKYAGEKKLQRRASADCQS